MNGRCFTRVCLAAVTFLSAATANGQFRPAAPQSLVPVQNVGSRQDVLGFSWDIEVNYGAIGNGTNSCFSMAEMLMVNGSQFSVSGQAMMTPDGSEYVLTRSRSGVLITRRIKLDL